MSRDRQRAKVYAWEDRVVAPHAPDLVPFAAAQAMVDAIWAEQGLRYPPLVEKLPRHASRKLAEANRLVLRLPEALPSWILLHELAHAMTTDHDGRSDGHGPRFMGLYLALLQRYLRLDTDALLPGLRAAGIRVERDAKPIFVDG